MLQDCQSDLEVGEQKLRHSASLFLRERPLDTAQVLSTFAENRPLQCRWIAYTRSIVSLSLLTLAIPVLGNIPDGNRPKPHKPLLPKNELQGPGVHRALCCSPSSKRDRLSGPAHPTSALRFASAGLRKPQSHLVFWLSRPFSTYTIDPSASDSVPSETGIDGVKNASD